MKGYIYQIENLKTGKSYIGQTINFNKRKNKHLSELRRNKHNNCKLQNAFNVYGEQEFHFRYWEFEIKNQEELDRLECEYIEKFDSIENGYNIMPGGGVLPLNQKTNNEDIIKFLCINFVFGDGYGKVCEEIFGWAKGTASTAKRKKGYTEANTKFEAMSNDEKIKIANKAMEEYNVEEVKLKRQTKQGGCLKAYSLSKEDYYYAFYLQEKGYGYTKVANLLGIKPLTVKDWFNDRSRKKEKEEYLKLSEQEKLRIAGARKSRN